MERPISHAENAASLLAFTERERGSISPIKLFSDVLIFDTTPALQKGKSLVLKVDPIGIEPTTSTLPVWRSPS